MFCVSGYLSVVPPPVRTGGSPPLSLTDYLALETYPGCQWPVLLHYHVLCSTELCNWINVLSNTQFSWPGRNTVYATANTLDISHCAKARCYCSKQSADENTRWDTLMDFSCSAVGGVARLTSMKIIINAVKNLFPAYQNLLFLYQVFY